MSSGVSNNGPSTRVEPSVPASSENKQQTAKTSDVASQIFSGMHYVISMPLSLLGRVFYGIWSGVHSLINLVSQTVSSILNPSKTQKPTQPGSTQSQGVSKLIQSYTEDEALKGKSNTEKVAHLEARIAKIEKSIAKKNAYCKKAEEKELAHAKKEVTEMHARLKELVGQLTAEQKKLEESLVVIEKKLGILNPKLAEQRLKLDGVAPGKIDQLMKFGQSAMKSGDIPQKFIMQMASQSELMAQLMGAVSAGRFDVLEAFEKSHPELREQISRTGESMMASGGPGLAIQDLFEQQSLILEFGQTQLKVERLQAQQSQNQEAIKKLSSRLANLKTREDFFNIEDSASDERFFAALDLLSKEMLAGAQSLEKEKADLLAVKAHFEALEAKEKVMSFVEDCKSGSRGQTNHEIVQSLRRRIMDDDAEIAVYKASGDNPPYLKLLEVRKPLLEGAKAHFEKLDSKQGVWPYLCSLIRAERRA
jgi:hypothetical protein